jgi:hypothetical protein
LFALFNWVPVTAGIDKCLVADHRKNLNHPEHCLFG